MEHTVIGPRGGITKADVSCYTCLCGAACALTKVKHLGCADWVNEIGQRVYFPPIEPGKIEVSGVDVPVNPDGKDCTGCGRCQDVLEPPPIKLPENMESAIPLQRELNRLHGARLESLAQTRARLVHIHEEVEAGRLAPADISPEDAESSFEPDQDPEPCPPCECGDPDCSQLNGHPIPEEEPHE